jgi:sugar (pentulose or hexulose) kinase
MLTSLPHAGGTVQWALDAFAPPGSTADAIRLAVDLEGGADGVRFERDENGGMSVSGARDHHGRSHLLRAVLEWVARSLAGRLAQWQEGGLAVDRLTMTGGAARSEGWTRLVADATGRTVVASAYTEYASRGAAVLAARGARTAAGDHLTIASANLPDRREVPPDTRQ